MIFFKEDYERWEKQFDEFDEDDELMNRAADVVERRRGTWVSDDNVWWEGSETKFCSCCGQGISAEIVSWFKFCHNCGADMRAE